MFSRILLVLFTFSISAVYSSRSLGPSSSENLRIRLYLVHVDAAVYHHDCEKYQQLLEKVIQERPPKALMYCYKQVTSGFAAALTEEEAEKLKGEKGIFSVTKDLIYYFDVAPYDYDASDDDTN